MSPLRRLTNLSVCAVLIATVLAPFGAARASCGSQEGFWRTVSGPNFKGGSQTITALGVDAQASNRMFVTNGAGVMRSEDRGCSWKEVYNLADEPTLQKPLAGSSTIKGIVIPERGGARMYLMVEEQAGPVSSPHVIVGSNGGNDWQLSDTGLAPAGVPRVLHAAPSNPSVAYLTVDVAGSGDLLYATTDGGATWQLRSRQDQSGVVDLEVDPQDANDLWVAGPGGLFHSTDGGTTSTAVSQFAATPMGPIDVFHSGKTPPRIMAFLSTGGGRYSTDGGRTWPVLVTPGPPNSVAHGGLVDSVLIATASGVHAYAPSIINWVDLNAPVSGIRGLVASRAGAQSFFGFTARAIAIYTGPIGTNVKIPKDTVEIPDISLIDQAPPDIAQQARLAPGTSKVKLDIGETKTVTYDLVVPRTLTPLDVYFVVDTSSSMTQVIKEAAEALEEIHNGLVRSGAAVEFGLAEYRSYPTDVPPRPDTDNYVYQRVLDVGASAPEMAEAISGLAAEGGGIYDAQLEALWQTATGEGKDVWPVGPSSRDVPPGLQANFRKKALRVILHVGDEPFGREDSAADSDNNVTRPEAEVAKPDIPEFDAVAAALRANGVKQLGLSLYPDATPDLRKMAAATGALAPPEGVDCDRDGKTDVPAGEPLVCVLQQDEIDDANMAPAIVELVEAIRSRSAVGLVATSKHDEIIQSVTPERYDEVILQADNSLQFDVQYRCPRSLAGKTVDIDLHIRGLIGAPPAAEAQVLCAPIEPKEEARVIPLIPQVLGLVPIIPIAPPPAPPNVPSATQAQAQAQANAAFAAQEQEQPQVAFAHQLHSDVNAAFAKEEDYTFTSLHKEQAPPYPLWAAALLMSAGFGVAMSTRTRVRLKYARRR